MALLYADEDFHYTVVECLRRLGHDVLTVQEAGRQSEPDTQVLSDATGAGRAVLTFNRGHIRRLHRQNPSHAGIVSCTPDSDLDALANRIDRAIAVAGNLAGQHIRINRPSIP